MNIVACLRCVQLFGLPNDGTLSGCPSPYTCSICGHRCGFGFWTNGHFPAIRSRTYPKGLKWMRASMRDSPPRLEKAEGVRR